jgi:2-methylcitrate dehydratase PrpD
LESNIPPMLAAQSDFPPGPLAGFHKIFNLLSGTPTNPLTREEIEEKFRRCAGFARNPVPADRVGEILLFLREMENRDDVTRIFPPFS